MSAGLVVALVTPLGAGVPSSPLSSLSSADSDKIHYYYVQP